MKSNLASALASAPATNDIRAIKPPIEVPGDWTWLWWVLAAGLVLAGLVAWHLRRKRMAHPAPVPLVPPHVRAKRRLAEALAFIGDPNRFCTVVSGTIRIYLEERFELRAPERTTEEFLVELRKSPHLTPDQKESLGRFLESCDLVKFARYEPTESTLRELHEAALRLIDETQFEPVEADKEPEPLAGEGHRLEVPNRKS